MRHRRAVLLLILAASRSVAAEDLPRGVAVAPHPMAATTAEQVLRAGGTAADAAIAAQMMLTVVQPQESGLGGGSMLLHFDGTSHEITNWDGREVAPAGVTPELFHPANGMALPTSGGRFVGVPGTVRMLEGLYQEHGHLPWADLLAPAIRAAEAGVPVSPALADAITAHADRLKRQPAAKALFFGADGAPLAAGSLLVNPALAATLRAIATGGANALLHGPIAADIATTVRVDADPGLLTTDDLVAYSAQKRVPNCLSYRNRTVCVAAPPAAGPEVLEALGLLRQFDLSALDPAGADAAHLLGEAERLAAADCARYLADPDFVHVPLAGLLASDYLTVRAQSIDATHTTDAAPAWSGLGAGIASSGRRADHGTSALAVVDAAGNAVSLTSSLGGTFGSHLVVRGFLLNAAMADFARQPDENGRPVANRVEPGKRPATPMTPAFVLDRAGGLVAVLGSAGGARIPAYVVQGVAGLVDWALPPAKAVAVPHVVGIPSGVGVEPSDLVAPLEPGRMGTRPTQSDAAIILVQPSLQGTAERRREGAVAAE